MTLTTLTLDGDQFANYVDTVVPLFIDIWGGDSAATTRRFHNDRTREGFKAIVIEDATSNDTTASIAAFGFGHICASGQYFYDDLLHMLAFDQARSWLMNAFEIAEIAVSPDYRRHGLATKMLTLLLEQATAVKATTAILAVRDYNQPAIDLYRKLDWQTIATDLDFGNPYSYMLMGLRADKHGKFNAGY